MSALSTADRLVEVVSTTGASPVTVIVSSSAPTRISASTPTVAAPASVMPSRSTVLNPGRLKVTV